MAQHRRTVADDDHRRAGGRARGDGLKDPVFGQRVEVGRRLVEKQHGSGRSEHPGQPQSLSLTERETDASASQHRRQPIG